METGLRGRSALISGGSRGIGKGIAHALAREGVNVALIARNKDGLAAALPREIAETSGVVAIGVAADITDTKLLKSALSEIAAQPSFKMLNIVVNDAAPPITRMDR